MPDIMLYRAGSMQQVCLPGDLVGIWDQKVWTFGKITLVEGLPYGDPFIFNLGAIAAGGVVQPVQLPNLAMSDLEFGQFRMRVLDDVAVGLWMGTADRRWRTKNQVARVTLFSHLMDEDASRTEFFVNEDDYAYIGAWNETSYPLAVARVAFWGFRYRYEPAVQPSGQPYTIKNPPGTYTRIPAQAF